MSDRREALTHVLRQMVHLPAKTTFYAAAAGAVALMATGDTQQFIDLGVAGLGIEVRRGIGRGNGWQGSSISVLPDSVSKRWARCWIASPAGRT